MKFSSKSERFGTSIGNIWVTRMSEDGYEVEGVSHTKALSEEIAEKKLLAVSCNTDVCATDDKEALIELQNLFILNETLSQYQQTNKPPLLIVGANTYIRNISPAFLVQKYDIHLFFYPNSMKGWVCGAAFMSRTNSKERIHFIHSSGQKIVNVIQQVIDLAVAKFSNAEFEDEDKNVKLNSWWTNWVYRCPKLSLKDVLHLEDYSGFDPEIVTRGFKYTKYDNGTAPLVFFTLDSKIKSTPGYGLRLVK